MKYLTLFLVLTACSADSFSAPVSAADSGHLEMMLPPDGSATDGGFESGVDGSQPSDSASMPDTPSCKPSKALCSLSDGGSYACGLVDDGCGGMVSCGMCDPYTTCGWVKLHVCDGCVFEFKNDTDCLFYFQNKPNRWFCPMNYPVPGACSNIPTQGGYMGTCCP
jgi:hypothetical protein